MEKYFITYQPQKVFEILCTKDYIPQNTDYNQIENEFGYNPIFFISLENKLDFLIKNIFSSPSKPDVMIITKLHRYDCINAAKWYEAKGREKVHNSIKANLFENVEKEFISDKILKDNVVKIISVDKMTKDIHGINDLNKTKMLVNSQKFWEILEQYFWEPDKRDMYKFVMSPQFVYVTYEFGKTLLEQKMGQADTMQWFRDKLSEISKDFDWF